MAVRDLVKFFGNRDKFHCPIIDYHNKSPFSVSAMSNEDQPSPVNRITPPRPDSYWFAHSGGDDETSPGGRNNNKHTDSKEAQQQKEREERIRIFREQQEEERVKRLKELEQSFELSKKFREQQEEERKRKIEEARVRESERRQQVEERKRQIWEAEQERKEAILRRNLEREARIEARRNAQRNSMCFAFGSSTPRTFDLDLAALGSSPVGCSLMSSVSVRRSEEKEIGVKRATSACSLDRKAGDDCMSRSMISLSSASRGRRRTDLTPVMPRERSVTPHTGTPRGNMSMRAVSMTRLDQLAQPRRRYLESSKDNSSTAAAPNGPRTVSPSMSKSMCNLANAPPPPRRLARTPSSRGSNMSRSMLQLPGNSLNQGYSAKSYASPTSPTHFNKPPTPMRSAQSMTHLAVAPRLTRAARLRADALSNARQDGKTTSMMNLHKSDSYYPGKLSGKDGSRSPTRPQSSMSGRSEISMTSSQSSSVSLRPRLPPRKPRPVSYAGTTVDRLSYNLSNALEKQTRSREPTGTLLSAAKPHRSKSSELDAIAKNQAPVKKPVPPPKTAQVLAKAKSHPVPTKDNLRKGVKMSNGSVELPNAAETVAGVPLPDAKKESPNLLVTNSELNTAIVKPVNSIETNADQLPNPSVVKDVPNPSVVKKAIQETLPNSENSSDPMESHQVKSRITSEEEARAALAEKRKLAREQAERDAELERQRQEELRRQEEERRIQEELEQKRLEEEQIRLAKLHRKLEEEKLEKAIKEQQQREKEEKAKKDEEARLRIEREEQDRKAREEAEQQRLELEERLRKEELERAERKKRVEQIMSRTRNKSNAGINKASPASENAPLMSQSMDSAKSNVILNSTVSGNSTMYSSNHAATTPLNNLSSSAAQPLNLDILMTNNSSVKNGYHGDVVDQSFVKNNTVSSDNCVPNRTPNSDAISPLQTNGYSSHEEMSVTSSPDDRSEKSNSSVGLLLDLQSSHPPPPNVIPRGHDNQLIDLGDSTKSSNDNYLIHPDVVNSNLVPASDPFHTFESNLPKKQETAIADLLS